MIMNPTAIKHVVVDGHSLTLESFVAIARYNATVELAPSALEAMKKSRALAEKIAAEGRVAYGITTGFGEFQKVAVPKEMSNQLSTNLILSHCTAAGEPYADEIVRGMMLLRANALCGGVSGVRPILVEMLLEMLNKGVTPVVPQKGSLGSSGDLAPLAHMTLPMLGKGEAMYEGVKMPGAEAMAKAGIKTLDTGIIGPLVVSATVVAIHDRFYDAKVPDWLGTFSGSSLVYLISFFAVFALAAISAAIVPSVYAMTETLRHALTSVGPFGVGIFVFLERALEPMGLHHLLYMPIYYDNLVINDGIYATWSSLLPILSHSTRPLNELAPWAGFTATGWVKLFGLPAIAAAFYSTAKPERRAGLRVILVPAIIASVVCGVTEPLEFLFMFTHPGLFLLYAVLSSCLATTMNLFGIVGIFSGGLMEMAAFNFIPLMRTHAGAYLLALGIGLAFSLIFFVSFRALILVYDLKTPGREDHAVNRAAIDCLTGSDFAKEQSPNDEVKSRSDQDHVLAERVIQLLGGVGNIVGATNCATRLRVEVADPSIVADNASFVAVGAKGLIITGKTAQVIIGISVPRVKEHFDQIMGLEPEFVPTTSASPAASAAHKRGNICFFDIDGTLAWQDPRLAQDLPEDERDLSPYPNEAVSQAIREFVANGNMAFICTGRTLSCIHPKLLELPWTGIVCLAGGYAEINGHAIRDLSMTPSMLQRLAPYLEQSGEVIRFEGLNGVVRMSADAPEYARTLGDAVTQLQHYSVYKILMSTSLANHIAQDKALEPLLCFNELELEVTEISPRECTKRGGIQSVLDALDPHHGTVYGIGDASNDVSLMNAVDVGIAMGNAPDYLKDKADYVTDTVDHDGVVAALEHFRLI